MWQVKFAIFSVGIVVLANSGVSKAQVITKQDVDRAQVAMINRVSENIKQYAEDIFIDHTFINYCRIELNLKIDHVPDDGSIPYGVNYNTITDKRMLEAVLDAREAYETGFLMVCLANAKAKLKSAER